MRRAILDDLAGIHNRHAVGHIGYHTQVVGDKDNGIAVLLLNFLHEFQDLRLDGHV